MNLSLQSHRIAGVAVIRCQGRIVVGDEVRCLQDEVEKHHLETKKYILQLGEVTYVDSGGLGALVRLAGTLRAHHGDLKLCQVSPFMQTVLKATNLSGVFPVFATEQEALASFGQRPAAIQPHAWTSNTKVLCIDPSSDLLAYMTAVLKPAGFEVKTTRYLADASTLLTAMKPRVVICGPGVQSGSPVFDNFRRQAKSAAFLLLPQDFHTSGASDAGSDLISRLQSLLQS
jgi:anti-anti-sigma factor